MALDGSYVCPVCGYNELDEPPWHDGAGSDEICPCCATHFGYDDALAQDALKIEQTYLRLRDEWVAGGCVWWSRSTLPPDGWDAIKQLKNLVDD